MAGQKLMPADPALIPPFPLRGRASSPEYVRASTSSRQQPMHRSQRLLEPVDSIVPSIVEAVCRTKMLQLLSTRRDCPRLLLEEGHRKLIKFHITRIPLSEYLKNFGADLIRAVSLIEVMAAMPPYLPMKQF